MYLSRYTTFSGVSKNKVEQSLSNFGVRLRALIERKGVTIAQFAADFGLGESQAFNWLKRDRPPLAKHWPKLAQYFGVSEGYIATGTPQNPQHPPLFRGDTDDLPSDPYPSGAELKPSQAEEMPGMSQADRATVRAARLRHRISTQFKSLLDTAGHDLERLGWLRTQVFAHLQIPADWSEHESVEIEAKLDQAEAEAREGEQPARPRVRHGM